MTTSEWDRRFLSLAEYISGWSKDLRVKIDAVKIFEQARLAFDADIEAHR